QDGSTRCRRPERAPVGQSPSAAAWQTGSRSASGRHCQHHRSGKPASHDITEGCRGGYKMKQILRRHNLHWEMPTKTFPTIAAIAWLKQIVLPEIDHLEMNHLLINLQQVQQRMKELEKVIAQRYDASKEAAILSTMPGMG